MNSSEKSTCSFEYLRAQLIGNDTAFSTPYGLRHIFYADYTASGRGLRFIEEKILNIQRSYANTHTMDDYSGSYLTDLLRKAETKIKELVNAGPHGKIVSAGSGATGALKHLQEIIGVSIPPVTKERIYSAITRHHGGGKRLIRQIEKAMPVIFIGPYEHHTNELMWREAFAEVVVIPLDSGGRIDLVKLEEELSSPRYAERTKIGSFSAGSNITGIQTAVYDIARICHRNGASIFFDYAAVAPYIDIDMNHGPDTYFDALFFSPHKFIGGPGTAGVLVFNEKLYREDLPPTTAGGGTVDYVGYRTHDFSRDIETREKAGTPPILQTIKTALVMDLKRKIGTEAIEKQEQEHKKYFFEKIRTIPGVDILGSLEESGRSAIVSFNIRHRDRILHPRFVTRLMNDLFGIQSRAGCSCAGPYGHTLLGIAEPVSEEYREMIHDGVCGLKPGWIRINLHYLFTREDIDYLLSTVRFIAEKGPLFLRRYVFNFKNGDWHHIDWRHEGPDLDVDSSFDTEKVDIDDIHALREKYLEDAEEEARRLESGRDISEQNFKRDPDEIEHLKYFYYTWSADR